MNTNPFDGNGLTMNEALASYASTTINPFEQFPVVQIPPAVDNFITNIFRGQIGEELPLFCSKSKFDKGWAATTDRQYLNQENDCYFAVSTFKKNSMGKYTAKKEQVAAVYVILLDDIGTKSKREMPVPLSWLIETSRGNYQGGLIFKEPCRDIELYQRVVTALGNKGFTDPGASGCARWARLPMGRNLKKNHCVDGVSPEVKLIEWYPERRYSIGEIIAAFGLETNCEPPPFTSAPLSGLNAEFFAGLDVKEPVDIEKLRSALDAVPCSKDYRKWLSVGMALHASMGDDGLFLWHSWSSKYEAYDAVELDAKWKTFNSGCANPLTVASIYKRAKDEAGWDWKPNGQLKVQTPPTQIKTMADLLNTTFAAIRWVITDLLPEGLAILSGPPKIGKSWMVMNLCLAVSWAGCVFGKFKVDQGEVLLLSLEDNERRLKGRLKKCMAGANKNLSNFHTTTEWKRLDQGGLEELARWLDLHPDCKLVVIDTIQKIKAHPKRKNGNSYENDYDSYGDLQRMALQHRCCILVIHHNRKSDSKNDGDPLEAISGSTGVTGSMDTILMLRRPRGATGAVLMATGRDISEAEYAMEFDGNLGQWVVSGKVEELVLHDGSNASHILVFMKARPGDEFTAQDIFEHMESKIPLGSVKTELYRMARRKIIVKKRGKFAYHANTETTLPVLIENSDSEPCPLNSTVINTINTNDTITNNNTSSIICMDSHSLWGGTTCL